MFDRKKTIILTLLSMTFLIPALGMAFDGQGRGKQNREDMFLNCLSSIRNSLNASHRKVMTTAIVPIKDSIPGVLTVRWKKRSRMAEFTLAKKADRIKMAR